MRNKTSESRGSVKHSAHENISHLRPMKGTTSFRQIGSFINSWVKLSQLFLLSVWRMHLVYRCLDGILYAFRWESLRSLPRLKNKSLHEGQKINFWAKCRKLCMPCPSFRRFKNWRWNKVNSKTCPGQDIQNILVNQILSVFGSGFVAGQKAFA